MDQQQQRPESQQQDPQGAEQLHPPADTPRVLEPKVHRAGSGSARSSEPEDGRGHISPTQTHQRTNKTECLLFLFVYFTSTLFHVFKGFYFEGMNSVVLF